MHKIVRRMLVVFSLCLLLIIVIIVAGVYKFTYLSGKPGYDVDGNKIEKQVIEKRM